jgi:trigger factor
VQKASQEALGEDRYATQPRFNLKSDINDVNALKADLAYELEADLMPEFEPMDPKAIALEKPVADVSDAEITETLDQIAKSNRSFEAKDGPAADGDALVIDFLGKIDGVAFDGGAAEKANVMIGAGRFIPGFEEQLVGVKAGEEKVLNVTFPEEYPVDTLKGKAAAFEVKVHEVKGPVDRAVDEELAKSMGFETLDALKDAVRGRLQQDYAAQSRSKVKRVLFDQLDAGHSFALPVAMVDSEFEQIWTQVSRDKERGMLDEDDKDKSEDQLRADYRKIAERRVRLGLVLAEIGRRNNVEIQNEELSAAVMAEARKYPGQEREVIEMFQQNPNLVAQLRAPIYEEKVVDFILELAKVSTKTVSKEELMADDPAPAQ